MEVKELRIYDNDTHLFYHIFLFNKEIKNEKIKKFANAYIKTFLNSYDTPTVDITERYVFDEKELKEKIKDWRE